MAAAPPKKPKTAPAAHLKVSGGTIIQTPRSDMVIVRVGKVHPDKKVAADQMANTLVPKMVGVFKKLGVDRTAVFRSHTGKPVYAYSLDPKDPSRIIKEDRAGKQTIGRMATDGTFKAARSKAA